MARPRQPIELVIAKGKKNLTKEEIQERLSSELKPIADEIAPPDYLTKKQKAEFDKIARQLQKLKIMGETDVDALARYIVANDMYIVAVKKLRSRKILSDPFLFDAWTKTQDRYFKQARACATDLGLTISSRCRLVVPTVNEEVKKENKFKKFEKVRDDDKSLRAN